MPITLQWLTQIFALAFETPNYSATFAVPNRQTDSGSLKAEALEEILKATELHESFACLTSRDA